MSPNDDCHCTGTTKVAVKVKGGTPDEETLKGFSVNRYGACGRDMFSCVCNVLREDSSAGLLVEFHQHATGLHITDRIACHPNTIRVLVYDVRGAVSKPPTTRSLYSAAATRVDVIVAVWSAEHSSIGVPAGALCRRQRITGVSAVPGHRQLVLTNLITDGERRVFSRVPQTRSTMDLYSHRQTLPTEMQFIGASSQFIIVYKPIDRSIHRYTQKRNQVNTQ